MPRQRRSRFTRRKATVLPVRPVAKQPCCVVCYNEFTPYPLTCNSWEASMGKVFYKVLNIPSMQGNDVMEDDESNEDEDDSIISLPFCPQCHSKVSVMFSLNNQLQFVQEQFNSVRNDVAFTVVETISKNCRNGPMDYIRQQIFQQWQSSYAEAKTKDDLTCATGSETEAEAFRGFGDNSPEVKHPAAGVKSLKTNIMQNANYATSLKDVKERNSQMKIEKAGSSSISRLLVAEAKLTTNTVSSFVGKRPHSPIPAMPKLIPMAKLQADAQRGQKAKYSCVRMLNQKLIGKGINEELLPGKEVSRRDTVSPDISPPSPPNYDGIMDIPNQLNQKPKLLNGPRMQHSISNRSVNPQRRVPVGRTKVQLQIGKVNKTEMAVKRRRRRRTKFSDDSFEGLTTKDIILKQNMMETKSGKPLKCKICPRRYTTRGRLMRHEGLCHPALKAHRCQLCPKGFSSTLTLRRHLQNIHHSPIEGYTMCPLCDRSFIKKYAFDVHLKTHEEQGFVIPPLSPSDMPAAPKEPKAMLNSKRIVKQSTETVRKTSRATTHSVLPTVGTKSEPTVNSRTSKAKFVVPPPPPRRFSLKPGNSKPKPAAAVMGQSYGGRLSLIKRKVSGTTKEILSQKEQVNKKNKLAVEEDVDNNIATDDDDVDAESSPNAFVDSDSKEFL